MASQDLHVKAQEALVALNAAIKNIRLYPPASAMVQKSIERVLTFLEAIYESEEELAVAEPEKNLLIFGAPLTEKELQKPQVVAFIAILLDFGIKSLAIKKGVTAEELAVLFQTLSRKAEDVNAEGGLQATLADSNLPHILLDEKVYMTVDGDQPLVDGNQPLVDGNQPLVADIGIAGAEIGKFIASGQAASDQEMGQLKELAKDPAWVANVFSTGIKELHGKGAGTGGSAMAGTLQHLVETFESLTDKQGQTAISQKVAATVVSQDDETLIPILAEDYAGKLGKTLFSQILDRMPDDQFERIVLKLKDLATTGDRTASLAYQNLLISEKGQQVNASLQARATAEPADQKQKAVQFKTGLKDLVQGKAAPLDNPEFLTSLPSTATQLIEKGKLETAETIAVRLTAGLAGAAPEHRSQIYQAIKSISQKLPEDNRAALAAKTRGNQLQWVQIQTTLTPEYEEACQALAQQALRLIKARRLDQLNVILGVFNAKAAGKQAGEESVKQHALQILDTIGNDQTWDLFLNQFNLLEENLREPAIQTQALLGIATLDRLLDTLQGSEEMSDRVRLVRVITEIGRPAAGVICNHIEQGGPWYYLRNLTALLGKIGGPDEVDVLQPLLGHKDLRIQREALNSVYNIGGDRRGPVLLNALPAATDKEKVSLVAMLGALKVEEAVAPLVKILGSKPSTDARTRAQLFEKTCVALGRIGDARAKPELEKVAQGKGPLKKVFTPTVQEAAQKALILIEKAASRKPAPASEPKTAPQAQPAPAPPIEAPQPATKTAAKSGVDEREVLLEKHIAAGETEAAVKLIFELVVANAKQKNFKKAEALRDQLYDVDAMALTEIVRAGEIIEQEKAESIDQDHLDVWPELYDRLSSEEANALFHAMETVTYEADQTVFAQGRENRNLYFITEGNLKLVYQDGEQETLLKTLEKGDLAGHTTFFTISMCTTSLVALSTVKMNVLSRDVLEAWDKDFPALKSKLEDYCLTLEKAKDIIKEKGMERRKQERFNVKGKILVQLLNKKRQPMGKPFKGDFSDISEGGLSFFIITSKRETARMLLGRRLGMKFLIPTRAAPLKTFQQGTVICVNYHLKNDYSIHVSFDDELPAGIAGAIRRLKNIKSE
ncbi:MAG: hypothetical protein [Olavius algarvensis Delta 4 endosymbiont]|nr:MAG: hypothetical protein [Olavius algarvensis Delta 4 endosymbiont]